MADDKTTANKDDKRPPLQAVAPDNKTPQFDQSLILKRMIDPVSGFYLLLCSDDNGVTWFPEYSSQGKIYHQRDINRIAEIPFDKIKMRSPSGAVFSFTVDNDGNLKRTKVGDSQ